MSETDYSGREDILKKVNMFKESRVLLTAVEIDIFSVLDTHMLTLDQITEKTGTDPKATERLLAVLAGMEIIHKTKTKYYNTDVSKRFLNKHSNEYLGVIDHANNLWGRWSNLTKAVKLGKSVDQKESEEESEKWRKNFIQAMHGRGVRQAELISYMIDFSGTKKILDVGGGSGAFTFAFLKRNKNAEAIIFDLPEVIPITKEYVDKSEFNNRIKYIGGDYLIDEFPLEQDLIFLSAIVHINSYDENLRLIKKCADSLNPEGKLIVLDYVMSEDRIAPYSGALFALNMLVGTSCGDTYTQKEITEWYNAAGITEVEFKTTSFDSVLVTGVKKKNKQQFN